MLLITGEKCVTIRGRNSKKRGDKVLLFFAVLESVEDLSEKAQLQGIYHNYSKYVKKMVLKHFPDLKEETEDVVQLVFLSVIKYRRCFINVPEEYIKNLLYIYTKNVCLNLLKRQKRHNRLFTDRVKNEIDLTENASDGFDVQKEVVKNECIKKVKELIKKLPYPSGDIVLMKYIHEMKNYEIAEVLKLTETNVGTILHRTLKKLKKEMEDGDDV